MTGNSCSPPLFVQHRPFPPDLTHPPWLLRQRPQVPIPVPTLTLAWKSSAEEQEPSQALSPTALGLGFFLYERTLGQMIIRLSWAKGKAILREHRPSEYFLMLLPKEAWWSFLWPSTARQSLHMIFQSLSRCVHHQTALGQVLQNPPSSKWLCLLTQ